MPKPDNLTHPARPFDVAVVIAVTVFTVPPPDVFVPVDVDVADPGGAAGVELGDESSRHDELLEPPTVRRLLEPPCTFFPASKAPRTNCVPAAMSMVHTASSQTGKMRQSGCLPMEVVFPTELSWNA